MDVSKGRFLDYEMMKEADRLKTFDNWPVTFIRKNDMAAAGFYFLGREDLFDDRSTECRLETGAWRRSPLLS
jgi:hypothetical protein